MVATYAVYAVLDVLLLPLVAALLGAVLLRAGNRRNLPLVALLVLLALANAAFHLACLDLIEMPAIRAPGNCIRWTCSQLSGPVSIT